MRLALHRAHGRLLFTESDAGLEDDHEHRVLGLDGALMSYVLILLVFSAAIAERFKLPASTAAIIIGAGFGAIFRAYGVTAESSNLSTDALITFDEELFLYVLLPPIIFEAGFTLSKSHFFSNLATILLFAVVGTLASTFCIGQAIYSLGSSGIFRSSPRGTHDALDFGTPLDSYLFGALISATDPVATLSIMGAVNADPLVYNLIFGESVLNDAVAIVLVRILEDMGKKGFSDPGAYFEGIGQFFAVSIGSLAVGIVISAISALGLKRIDLTHHPSFELSLILLFGYAAYSTAEAVGGSGILALFTTGVLCGHYHVTSLSPVARDSAAVTLKALAHLAETAVFAYMGVDLFAISGAGVDAFGRAHHTWLNSSVAAGGAAADSASEGALSAPIGARRRGLIGDAEGGAQIVLFVLVALVVVLLARVVVVLPLCFVANRFRGERRKLSNRAIAMITFAGLRGAIAFALAHNVHSDHQPTIAAATTTVVMATVFILGGATRTVLRQLNMEANDDGPPGVHHEGAAPHAGGALPGGRRPDSSSTAWCNGHAPGTTVGMADGAAAAGALPAGVLANGESAQGVERPVERPNGGAAEMSDAGRIGRAFKILDEQYLLPIFGRGPQKSQRRRRARVDGGTELSTASGDVMPLQHDAHEENHEDATPPTTPTPGTTLARAPSAAAAAALGDAALSGTAGERV